MLHDHLVFFLFQPENLLFLQGTLVPFIGSKIWMLVVDLECEVYTAK